MPGKPRELFPGGMRMKKKKRGPQEHEILLGVHLAELKVHYFREFAFHGRRNWRFDFAIPDVMLAIEIEGGGWGFGDDARGARRVGAHSRGEKYYDDCQKYREAAILGWAGPLRFSVEEVMTGAAKNVIARWLKAKAAGFRPEI